MQRMCFDIITTIFAMALISSISPGARPHLHQGDHVYNITTILLDHYVITWVKVSINGQILSYRNYFLIQFFSFQSLAHLTPMVFGYLAVYALSGKLQAEKSLNSNRVTVTSSMTIEIQVLLSDLFICRYRVKT